MEKRDFKKEMKEFYGQRTENPSIVTIPPMNFITIEGQGDPNASKEYTEALNALYSAAYTVKFMIKKGREIASGVMVGGRSVELHRITPRPVEMADDDIPAGVRHPRDIRYRDRRGTAEKESPLAPQTAVRILRRGTMRADSARGAVHYRTRDYPAPARIYRG